MATLANATSSTRQRLAKALGRIRNSRANKFIVSGALSMLLAGTAFAGHGKYESTQYRDTQYQDKQHRQSNNSGYYDFARVVDVQPILTSRLVNHPRRACWNEPVTERIRVRSRDTRRTGPAPAMLGGVLGGLLGHQFGDGNGRDALTVVGALAGAGIAHGVANRPRDHYETQTHLVERCELIDDYQEIESIDGYDVTYRYKGRTFNRVMDHDPGKRLRIRVRVAALDDRYSGQQRNHNPNRISSRGKGAGYVL